MESGFSVGSKGGGKCPRPGACLCRVLGGGEAAVNGQLQSQVRAGAKIFRGRGSAKLRSQNRRRLPEQNLILVIFELRPIRIVQHLRYLKKNHSVLLKVAAEHRSLSSQDFCLQPIVPQQVPVHRIRNQT